MFFDREMTYLRNSCKVMQQVSLEDSVVLNVRPVTVSGGISEDNLKQANQNIYQKYVHSGELGPEGVNYLLMYANVTLFMLVKNKILVPKGHQLRPMKHNLERHNIGLDYGVFFLEGEEKARVNHREIVSPTEALVWPRNRSVPGPRPKPYNAQVKTHLFEMQWWQPTVKLPKPLYGFLSASNEEFYKPTVDALYSTFLEDAFAG